ncbi:hypothetical protein A3A39_02880 [Candidatus Kaiserbacteria bacterium RIFCSPLOWO2_01_FULL_54_13]|uniref:Uncharacterized protein n=1 Tax=Candidatus Kaiserbacteria bacterium RIFCSPLOWO2_01_FULL_54_13 TaxID=1798512 RepID=A0A1F6F2T9_9BACT|nr:MAG: hypothetical protein A3A39_02880 [Candidatus Kaiserbacteria bacterium RIFCSPLOWO2_01_FULL_54_13]
MADKVSCKNHRAELLHRACNGLDCLFGITADMRDDYHFRPFLREVLHRLPTLLETKHVGNFAVFTYGNVEIATN